MGLGYMVANALLLCILRSYCYSYSRVLFIWPCPSFKCVGSRSALDGGGARPGRPEARVYDILSY